MDVDDAVASEVFYMNWFTSRARSFHPGFAMDLHGLRRGRKETGVQVQGDDATEIACWSSRAQDVEPVVKPLERQRVVCGEVHALFETGSCAHVLRTGGGPQLLLS